MFTLTGRTFISYEDHLGRATVSLLTQSQGNSDEKEWYVLLVDLIASNQKVYIASFRGMAVDIEQVKSIIFNGNIDERSRIVGLRKLIMEAIQIHEKKISLNFNK